MDKNKREELKQLKHTVFLLMEEVGQFPEIFKVLQSTWNLTFTVEIYNLFLAVIKLEMECTMQQEKCPYGFELGYDFDGHDVCNCSGCSGTMFSLCQRMYLNNQCLLTIIDNSEINGKLYESKKD